MQPSDTALVLACRRGDEAAWEALVERYERLIFTISRRTGLDADQSADVFQRVFTGLIEHIDNLAQPERVGAWLVTAARRESYRAIKRERATLSLDAPAFGDSAGGIDLPDDGPLPEEELVALEEQHRIRVAMGGLDERCRQLLTLLFYRPDPPPYNEVSAQLGLPVGSIGPTRARCLQKLRKLVE